jgi:hypothetical protein
VKRIAFLCAAVVMVAGAVAFTTSASGHSDEEAAPVYGVRVPPGYRDWRLISVARVGDPLNDLRAKLGNDTAMKAYREGKLPFPDGTIIARLAWQQVTSGAITNAFRVRGGTETHLSPEQVEKLVDGSFVSGPPTNVQFMVKDSKNYASTGGWGFAQFDDGKPADEATHKTCFSCHEPAKGSDYVFTRYAP